VDGARCGCGGRRASRGLHLATPPRGSNAAPGRGGDGVDGGTHRWCGGRSCGRDPEGVCVAARRRRGR
jgi:hypothetical protein